MTARSTAAEAVRTMLSRWGAIAALLVVTAAAYATTIDYEATWDDELFFTRSPKLTDLSNLSRVFSVDFWQLTETPSNPEGSPFYRPLALGFIIAERALLGEPVGRFRVVHALLHLANILLLYLLARALLGGALGPLLATAALAALPYTVDTVLFLTCISDLLATLFVLTALLGLLRWLDTGRPTALTVVALASAAAVFSKESAITLPLLLVVVAWLRPGPATPRRALAAVGLSLLAVAAYWALRGHVVAPLSVASIGAWLTWLPADLFLAFRDAVAPVPLVLEHDVVRTPRGPEWWAGVAGLAAVTFLLVRYRRRPGVGLGGLVIWGLAVFPSLVAVQYTGAFAPRYLYLPTVGLALVLGALSSLPSRAPRVALTGLLALAGLASLARTTDWKDGVTLWATEIGHRPTSTSALINLATLLETRGDYAKALPLQLRAAQLAEQQASSCNAAFAYSNAATILTQHLGDDDAASTWFRKCIALCPEKAQNAWLGLAGIESRAGRWREAEAAAREAGKLGTQQLKVAWLLGSIVAHQGRDAEALAYLVRARELAADDAAARASIDLQLQTLRREMGMIPASDR